MSLETSISLGTEQTIKDLTGASAQKQASHWGLSTETSITGHRAEKQASLCGLNRETRNSLRNEQTNKPIIEAEKQATLR